MPLLANIKQGGFSSGEKKKRSQSEIWRDPIHLDYPTIKILNLHNTKLFGSTFSTILQINHSKLGTLKSHTRCTDKVILLCR
jgi:hypothetical protein